jgi:hypothetical protein
MKEHLQSIVNPLDFRHFSDNLHPRIRWDRNSSKTVHLKRSSCTIVEILLSLKAERLDGMLHCGISVGKMKREFDDSLMKVP